MGRNTFKKIDQFDFYLFLTEKLCRAAKVSSNVSLNCLKRKEEEKKTTLNKEKFFVENTWKNLKLLYEKSRDILLWFHASPYEMK